jgi:hypothetical protein
MATRKTGGRRKNGSKAKTKVGRAIDEKVKSSQARRSGKLPQKKKSVARKSRSRKSSSRASH